MADLLRHCLDLWTRQTGKGQGLVEYALIIVLISIVSVAVMITIGGSITRIFTSANTKLSAP